MNQNGILKWWIILSVVFIAIIASGYILYNKPEATKESSTSTASATEKIEKMTESASNFGMTEETEKAISEVSALGDSVVPQLDKLIESGQIALVTSAGRALAEIGTPLAVSTLLDGISRKENNPDQKLALVSSLHALTKINSASSELLIQALIKKQDPILSPILRDTIARLADSNVVRAIANAFHELKPDIVEIGGGQKYDKNGWKQSNLMGTVLRVRSPQAVPALREIILNDSDFSLKSQAVIALGAIGDKDSIQAILDGIAKSTSTSYTRVLVETLTAINNKESLSQLIELLNNNANENIRYGAAGALGNISSETSITALKNALQKESSQLVKKRIQMSLKILGQS